METNEFIAKSLRALQNQIDCLTDKVAELKARVYSLEEESRWNVALGNLESCPKNDLVVRLANGNLGFHPVRDGD